MTNLFALKTKSEIIQEIRTRQKNTCWCGQPGKFNGYCGHHAPPEIKEMYYRRKNIELQALRDYQATPNDPIYPSINPDFLVLIPSQSDNFLQFAKVSQGKQVGLVSYRIIRAEVEDQE